LADRDFGFGLSEGGFVNMEMDSRYSGDGVEGILQRLERMRKKAIAGV
jgi:hypothetical protein